MLKCSTNNAYEMLKSEFQYFYPEWNVKKSGFSPQKILEKTQVKMRWHEYQRDSYQPWHTFDRDMGCGYTSLIQISFDCVVYCYFVVLIFCYWLLLILLKNLVLNKHLLWSYLDQCFAIQSVLVLQFWIILPLAVNQLMTNKYPGLGFCNSLEVTVKPKVK